ncbi:MAG TPA: hypothetical protein ENK91_14770 [Bacteroidetes bacterium]|nr:hypothetical protein [Bacteroidota bacterium]
MNILSAFFIRNKNMKEKYHLLYFLSSLGAGGLMVSFFMFFQFMIPHKGSPMVTVSHIIDFFNKGSIWIKLGIILNYVLIAFFAFKHLQLLFWNFSELSKFRKTEAFKKFVNSATGIAQMARPLTLAMTVNVVVIAAVITIPNLWNYVEILFPIEIIILVLIGIQAMVIFGKHMGRIILHGDADFVNGNNLSQVLSSFAFAMIAVGFSAPGAMSHHPQVNAIAYFFAILFLTLSVLVGFLKFILGMRAIFEKGIDWTAGPTLWLAIPILTLFGITITRLLFGLEHHAETPFPHALLYLLAAFVVSLQLLNLGAGYYVMRHTNYLKKYVSGSERTVGSLSLICPGVAFVIYGYFAINYGMVMNHLFDKFSTPYFVFVAILLVVQIVTVVTFFKLNKKLLYDK